MQFFLANITAERLSGTTTSTQPSRDKAQTTTPVTTADRTRHASSTPVLTSR